MAVKSCPNCGAIPVPEARFCRSCGALLKSANLRESEGPISPIAQTVPLSNEGRSTDGLAANDPSRAGSETGKVGQAEIESLLKRSRSKRAGDGEGSKGASRAIDLPTAQTTTLASGSIAAQETPENQSHPSTQESAPSATQPNVRSRRMWQAAAVVLLCVALVAGVLAFILSRRSNLADAGNASPISISDQKQLVNEKLAEADILLQSGEFSRAIAVLRSAVKLDPSNAEAHMRLGSALEKTGERGEAIGEYRAATQASPDNVLAWRSLASAQVAEKLYGEAADSYRRLIETAGDGGSVDDETRLAYADALRLAGRTEESRLAYQKISASNTETVAREARARLAELGPPAVAATNDPKRAAPREGEEERAASPSPQPSPTARVTQTPAPVDADAYYFRALNIVNGRDPRNLSDGELAAALNYFLLAQRGSHGAEAKRNADRLGKEYDRRKKK